METVLPGQTTSILIFSKPSRALSKAILFVFFFAEFHASGKLVRGLKAAFITLIPKQHVPESISDYMPISLIGSAYKLISKVLAARLKCVMPKLISHNQLGG